MSEYLSVTLSPSEMAMAAQVGARRHIEALKRGLPDRHGYDGDGWGVHVEGAAGELAVAKALGRYWDGSVNTFKTGGDLGDGTVQIRTRSRHDYDLLIRTDDEDEDYFILVTGKAPHYRVHGYLRCGDAKREEYLKSHGGRPPAYFVPKSALHPFTSSRKTAA